MNRATKSGFAAEAHAKIQGKYDREVADEVMDWVHRTLQGPMGAEAPSASGDPDDVHNALGDGFALLHLIKALGGSLSPGVKMQRQKMAFKKMESIGAFLEAAENYGLSKTDSFQTVDLYEAGNLWQVITCLQSLGRKAQMKGYEGIGPKEAVENRRSFTQEQMNAGQNVIGLQMGSNKGATQSGQNFGKSRMIVD